MMQDTLKLLSTPSICFSLMECCSWLLHIQMLMLHSTMKKTAGGQEKDG